MPKSTDTCNALLALLLNATTWNGLAENDTTGPLTNLYVALYTADPGLGGDPRTNEATYTNYGRIAVARSAAGWTVAGAGAQNAALIQFAQCGVTGNVITHVAIVTTASGDGDVLYTGELNDDRSISAGIQPQFSAGELTITEA